MNLNFEYEWNDVEKRYDTCMFLTDVEKKKPSFKYAFNYVVPDMDIKDLLAGFKSIVRAVNEEMNRESSKD